MSISIEQVRHVARLARVGLDDTELEALAIELDAILGWVARLDALELHAGAGAPPAEPATRAARADTCEPGLSAEAALAGAPDAAAGHFRVPRVIGA